MKLRMTIPVLIATLALAPASLPAQEFEVALPEEPADEQFEEPRDVVVVEDKAEVDGFFPRLVKFLGGARAESATGDTNADPWRAGTVSTDPDDPERKPRGTILFSFNW